MKKVMMIALLFSIVTSGCQDNTLKEVEETVCTSCPPEKVPPPGNND